MKVMVNGATGLVGLAVVDAFLEAGHQVRGSDRRGSDFAELESRGVEVVPADLDDHESLGRSVAGMDAVVHVAGLFDFGATPALLDQVNHQGTRNVCEAALQHAPGLKRFVQVSSVGVYGKPVRCPCQEDDPKRPRNAYERSKWRGELAAFEYHKKRGLPVTALRPTLIYGPRSRYGHSMFIAAMSLVKAMGRDTLLGLRQGPRTSHVHVDDVGRAAVLVAENDAAVGRAFNVAAPEPMDGPPFIRALAEPLGLEVKEVIPFFAPLMNLAGALLPYFPRAPERMLNRWLGKKWDQLQQERGLASGLRLRLDRDWVGYMTGDNNYDVSRLKELGMTWKWPDTALGLRETIRWYREREWIP